MSNIWLDPFGLKLLKRPQEQEEEAPPEEAPVNTQNTIPCYPGHPGYYPSFMPYYACQYSQPPPCYIQTNWPTYQNGCSCHNQPQPNTRCHIQSASTTVAAAEEDEPEVEYKVVPTFWSPRSGTNNAFKR